MSLPQLAIEKQPVTYFAIALVVVAGVFSYFQLGQLEDPEFSVKTASIITTYPGASAEQVELEVTDRIETKLQEMPELKNIYSNSRPGRSIIKVDIKNEYWSDRLPQVWDGLRKKIHDMETTLPPGAGRPKIGNDFGFVFGFLLAVTADGFTYAELEDELQGQASVVGVSSFAGGGPPRFYLPVNPEDPYAAYAQLIVSTNPIDGVDDVIKHIDPWLKESFPQALVRVRKYAVGTFDDWKLEARFSGPANADPDVLRDLAAQAMVILNASPNAKEVRTNWRQRVRELAPEYNQERGRWAGVSRDDIANATKRAYDGRIVGQYREDDKLIPIVARNPKNERQVAVAHLDMTQVLPARSSRTVPLSQVTDNIPFVWEDPIIWRWDRRRAITVQCSPNGVTAPTLRESVVADLEAIELPPGYALDWDGEYWSAKQSIDALIPGVIPTVVIMVFIIVMLFNAYRPLLIIFMVIPFVAIGITAGMLLTQAPFGFIALLGAMSLSGMMIKNAVVLLDQVNINLSEGMTPYNAVVEAAVSRLRPVVNAASTTVLGMAPPATRPVLVFHGGNDHVWISGRDSCHDGRCTSLVCIVLPNSRSDRVRIDRSTSKPERPVFRLVAA